MPRKVAGSHPLVRATVAVKVEAKAAVMRVRAATMPHLVTVAPPLTAPLPRAAKTVATLAHLRAITALKRAVTKRL
jgi:hypothetical protein